MAKRRLMVIGNGMAGIHCVEEILKLAPEDFEITVIGRENYPNYNRVQLSSVLSGESGFDEIVLNDGDWYERNGIALYTGETATRIDTTEKTVHTSRGLRLPYDELILATGSVSVMLPVPGIEKEGVVAFRDISDCRKIIEALGRIEKAIVIGGGLLGLETARGLVERGVRVTVVHLVDTLMEAQLDATASEILKTELGRQGIGFRLGCETVGIFGDERVSGVRFADGSAEAAELVVMAVGIRPDAAVAMESGLNVSRGIVVNDFLETSVPNVYAVGECAEHRGVLYGLVAPLFEQGAVLARRLCGLPTEPYRGSTIQTKLKVSGIEVFSAGEIRETPGTLALRVCDEIAGVYKKVLIRDGRAVGAILVGDARESGRLARMIRDGAPVAGPSDLAFLSGTKGTGGVGGEIPDVASLPDDEIICGCMGVTKGTIIRAVRENGLTSVAEVSAHTGASRSCGGCKPLVAELLRLELGDKYEGSTLNEPVCPCTRASREQVVAEIRAQRLMTTFEVMRALNWETPEGCSKCRPSLNYYLNMIWPRERADEAESRLVNERLMANIQNDGTFSVVPRMYGGVTTAEELHRIADVAETYGARMIKLTGGQRIALFGLRKEDLPAVWAELGMPSGSAYAKAVRTVKTCVGSRFCRYGTQDSLGLGIELERRFENLDTPAKIKMAVSGCPRNCAETAIKDFGVLGVDGGWEIYVGGNGGIHVRTGDLLGKAVTPAEAVEVCGAFLQLYREEARYGERTSVWIERIGLEAVRAAVFDSGKRAGLLERMEAALGARVRDPWGKSRRFRRTRRLFSRLKTDRMACGD